jgi:hypothetical protein
VKHKHFRYNFLVVDSQKSPSNRHAPIQFLELVRQNRSLSQSLRASSGDPPNWSNEPARFAMKLAGE